MTIVGKQRAFSLPELMVTLVLMAILVNLAIPSFQKILERQRLTAAAESLYAQLQLAKVLAFQHQQNIRLSFSLLDADHWCYGLSTAVCNCWQIHSCQIDGTERRTQYSEFPGISLAGSTVPWGNGAVFEPRQGNVTAGGATLASKNFQIRIKTSGQGRIRICNDHSLQTKTDLDFYPVCN